VALNHKDTKAQRNAAASASADAPVDPWSSRIIGLSIDVHRALGPGLLESAYEECLCYELRQHNVPYRKQVSLPVRYRELTLDAAYRIDLIVDDSLIVELKAVERILPVHEAQLLTYLKLSGIRVGLLLNFQTAVLRDGIRRLVL
jgi:GxxExxY protein